MLRDRIRKWGSNSKNKKKGHGKPQDTMSSSQVFGVHPWESAQARAIALSADDLREHRLLSSVNVWFDEALSQEIRYGSWRSGVEYTIEHVTRATITAPNTSSQVL